MTLVRQQAFPVSGRDTTNRDDRANGQDGSRADAAAYIRPQQDPTTNPDGRGGNSGGNGQGGGDHGNESAVHELANQFRNLTPAGLQNASRNINELSSRNAIPHDHPYEVMGKYARAATFNRGSLLRQGFSHAPWNNGRDGYNLSTAGKPFAFQSQGYTAARPFDANSSDIPENWVAGNLNAEMHNARLNSDKPYMRNLLAAGRYSVPLRA